jgi:hypothetical protein
LALYNPSLFKLLRKEIGDCKKEILEEIITEMSINEIN